MKCYPYQFNWRNPLCGVNVSQGVLSVLKQFEDNPDDFMPTLQFAFQLGKVLFFLGQSPEDLEVLREGIRFIDESTFTRWKVYPASTTDEELWENIGEDFPSPTNLGCEGRPGRWFTCPVWTRRGRSRVLVTQMSAMDI